jgi:hypothetical protein
MNGKARRTTEYLDHMLEAIHRINGYVTGLDSRRQVAAHQRSLLNETHATRSKPVGWQANRDVMRGREVLPGMAVAEGLR